MVKEFELKGLECANCAAKIEHSVKKLPGISSASVNLFTASLHVETSNGYSGDVSKEIKEIVRRYEPDVTVTDKALHKVTNGHKDEHGHGGHHNSGTPQIVRLIAGAVFFAAGIILSRFWKDVPYAGLAALILSYVILGGDVILRAVKNIFRGRLFDENFLMSIATIGAFALGDYSEAAAVMLFYQMGEFLQELAVRRSKKSITSLMDIRPDYANLKKDGEIIKVPPDSLSAGDIIVVKPGEKIPLDGVVIEGESTLDTSALTGESVHRKVKVSDSVLSGCINQNGVLSVEVTKPFSESTAVKIIDMVENSSSKKAPTENFITVFSRYYTPAVVLLALLIAVIPPLFAGGLWMDWIKRGLIFLVISCPCALVISIPLGFFGGIGRASKRGILIKGGNYLEALNKLDIVVFDKTGTLTKGVFEVTEIKASAGFSHGELLEFAAAAEAFSSHPIALSILQKYDKEINKSDLSGYEEIAGQGVKAVCSGKTIFAGNDKLMKHLNIPFEKAEAQGTAVYVAVDNIFAGSIVISDEIKPDSQKAVTLLKAKGVSKAVMLTGDNNQTAKSVAEKLKLDEVYGELLPTQKVEIVEKLSTGKRASGKLAFVGDGINDAPVLARADIGVAMGALGSDAAIEAADIVLMTDEPSKLAEAIDIAKFTKRIVWQNIIFALGVKCVFLLLGAFGITTMWEAVFADVGVALIAVLNAMRVMRAVR